SLACYPGRGLPAGQASHPAAGDDLFGLSISTGRESIRGASTQRPGDMPTAGTFPLGVPGGMLPSSPGGQRSTLLVAKGRRSARSSLNTAHISVGPLPLRWVVQESGDKTAEPASSGSM